MDKFNPKIYYKTYKYVTDNDTLNIRCNHCGKVVLREPNIDDYPFQCMNCDENLYNIEVHIGGDHSKEEFEELCINTREILGLDDIII